MASKGEETKKNIVEAAGRLFADKGFKDVTMSDICEATGLSRGGLYRHFSSTSEIFRELITQDYSFDDRIEAGDSAVDILNTSLDIIEQEITRKENSLSLAIYEFANIDGNRALFADIEKKAKMKWISLIEYGMRTGQFAGVSSEETAEMILFYYQGLRMWSRVMELDDKAAKNYRSMVLRVLTAK